MNLEHLELLKRIDNLPERAVLSTAQTCALLGLSEDTLRRRLKDGKGPPRVQLSDRRFGYTIGAVRQWLEQRSAVSSSL